MTVLCNRKRNNGNYDNLHKEPEMCTLKSLPIGMLRLLAFRAVAGMLIDFVHVTSKKKVLSLDFTALVRSMASILSSLAISSHRFIFNQSNMKSAFN